MRGSPAEQRGSGTMDGPWKRRGYSCKSRVSVASHIVVDLVKR